MTQATENTGIGTAAAKHIVAIASGKGGVGKSTVSVNLALALHSLGKRVGLLDADIYGPSQPGMLGSAGHEPRVEGHELFPVERYGVLFMSMGLLAPEDSPIIWRAPMAMKAIHQFLGGVRWGELDYLLIDLPPGTGDVQLTLAQQASLSGAVIVTTPQDVALRIALKGLRMFQQVNVPILGILENMSGFDCPHCGKETAIFKREGGKTLASKLNIPFLGAIPLDASLVESGDAGIPVVTNNPEGLVSKRFMEVARALDLKLNEQQASELEPREIAQAQDGTLQLLWPDGHRGVMSPFRLRSSCACATCIDENTGKRTLNPKSIPVDIRIQRFSRVGRYALGVVFSDGHSTGIFPFKKLRANCECALCVADGKVDSFSV